MNKWHQRHSSFFSKSVMYLSKSLGTAGILGFSLAVLTIAEPLISRDRSVVFAQTSQTTMQLNNILAQTTFGEDQVTRYAAAANAIENKRLEIFRAAKKNADWINVANLAESQQTKVCDLSQPPEFLQDLCNQLRTFTEKEIRYHGFTNKEFNQITREQRKSSYLRGLIQARQMQLRNGK